jgi:hypothetical protein
MVLSKTRDLWSEITLKASMALGGIISGIFTSTRTRYCYKIMEFPMDVHCDFFIPGRALRAASALYRTLMLIFPGWGRDPYEAYFDKICNSKTAISCGEVFVRMDIVQMD